MHLLVFTILPLHYGTVLINIWLITHLHPFFDSLVRSTLAASWLSTLKWLLSQRFYGFTISALNYLLFNSIDILWYLWHHYRPSHETKVKRNKEVIVVNVLPQPKDMAEWKKTLKKERVGIVVKYIKIVSVQRQGRGDWGLIPWFWFSQGFRGGRPGWSQKKMEDGVGGGGWKLQCIGAALPKHFGHVFGNHWGIASGSGTHLAISESWWTWYPHCHGHKCH